MAAAQSAPAASASTSAGDSREPARVSLSRSQVEQLVDDVVDRIERRVVEELERRGRRHLPGVF